MLSFDDLVRVFDLSSDESNSSGNLDFDGWNSDLSNFNRQGSD